jgi:hypothetical protein
MERIRRIVKLVNFNKSTDRCWKVVRMTPKSSFTEAGDLIRIQTGYLPNTSQKIFWLAETNQSKILFTRKIQGYVFFDLAGTVNCCSL